MGKLKVRNETQHVDLDETRVYHRAGLEVRELPGCAKCSEVVCPYTEQGCGYISKNAQFPGDIEDALDVLLDELIGTLRRDFSPGEPIERDLDVEMYINRLTPKSRVRICQTCTSYDE